MIINAKDFKLNQNIGTLPNVSSTLMNWMQPFTISKVIKTVVNHELVETLQVVAFEGVVEAGTPEQLEIKPEAQRSWKWVNIWTLPTINLLTDDIVESMGKNYRIKSKQDWAQYGYIQYEAVEDWVDV
jgi:hypothetical protein